MQKESISKLDGTNVKCNQSAFEPITDLVLAGLIHETERISEALALIGVIRLPREEQELHKSICIAINTTIDRLNLELERRAWLRLEAVIADLTEQSHDELNSASQNGSQESHESI